MPFFADDGASVWFPLVFPILFPMIFPMGFMMFFMIRRGGPMGMMGGRQHRPPADDRPPPRRSSTEHPTPEDRAAPAESTPGAASEPPLEVAQRRYATGEISRAEFLRLREDLGGS